MNVVRMYQWHKMSNSDIVEFQQPFVAPGDTVLALVAVRELEQGRAQDVDRGPLVLYEDPNPIRRAFASPLDLSR